MMSQSVYYLRVWAHLWGALNLVKYTAGAFDLLCNNQLGPIIVTLGLAQRCGCEM